MKLFTIPLYIEGTEEELKALVPDLEKMGYEMDTPRGRWGILLTCFNGYLNHMSNAQGSYKMWKGTGLSKERTQVSASNRELVLALAAMTDGQEAQEGEIWKYSGNRDDIRLFKIENINKTLNTCNIRRLYKSGGVIPDYYFPHFQGKDWVRATKEEIINLYQPSKAKEEEFPEKWCINTRELSKDEKDFLREHADKFKNKYGDLISLTYSNQSFRYYHFINLTPINTGEQHPISGYTEVTFSQFKKHIENITNMDKKIIGYRPKAGVSYEAAAGAIGADIKTAVPFWKERPYAFEEDSTYANKAKSLGVLDLLFEHVYEPEKPKEKAISLGSNALDIVISKDGVIKIPSLGTKTDVGSVEKLLSSFNTINQYKIAGYSISLSSDNRFLRIGCSGDNNLFSINELQQVVDTYKALQ